MRQDLKIPVQEFRERGKIFINMLWKIGFIEEKTDKYYFKSVSKTK